MSMHVTSFKIKAKPGERQAVIDNFKRWEQERKPKAAGFVRSALYSNLNDPEEFMATVVFDTTESYKANSNDPEQGKWYEELRSHLAGDPEWFDGQLETQALA